jgi:hypothetical protein
MCITCLEAVKAYVLNALRHMFARLQQKSSSADVCKSCYAHTKVARPVCVPYRCGAKAALLCRVLCLGVGVHVGVPVWFGRDKQGVCVCVLAVC